MGFSPEKRKFFVEAMGEERVRELEERLHRLGKNLEAFVGYKDMHPVFEEMLSFADAEAVKLLGIYEGIVGNIIHGADMSVPQKIGKLEAALADLKARIGGVKTAAGARVLVDDLLGQRPVASQAAKELRDSGAPASGIVADLLETGPIRG